MPVLDILWFALLTLAIAAVAGVPVLLSTQAGTVAGVIPPPRPFAVSQPIAQLLLVVSDAAPALAAIVIVGFRYGLAGVKGLLGQLLCWGANPVWYLIVLAGPTAIGLLAVAITGLMGRPPPGTSIVEPTGLTVALLILQALGQEVGWRGLAFPRLQLRFGAFAAALLTGTIWFIWREWRLITPGGRFLIQPFGALLLFLLLVAASVTIGWIYNRAGRRLPVAWAANFGLLLMATVLSMQLLQFAVVVGLFLLVAAVILLIDLPDTLSR